MKATIELPDALYREAKIRAAREGVKMKDLAARFFALGLGQPSPAAASGAKKKPSLPLYDGPLGPLLQGKDVRSLSFLEDEDDLESYRRALRR